MMRLRSPSFGVPYAAACFYALTAFGVLLWLYLTTTRLEPVDLELVARYGIAFVTLCCVFALIDLVVSQFFQPKIFGLRLMVVTYLPLLLIACDGFHYGFFREHLTKHNFETAYLALSTGEVPFDSAWYLWGAFLTAEWGIVTILIGKVLFQVVPQREFFVGRTFAVLPCFAVLPFLWVIPTESELSPYLTWDWLRGMHARLLPANSQPGGLSVFTEREQLMALEADREKILGAIHKAERRPNILLIYAEGLRADMLTPEVMPQLSAEAERCLADGRCLVQRHHYSTGNNSGTGVFGMLTGLNGYYYHVFRRQFFRPLPLQVLKRLGYKISFSARTNWRYDDLLPLFFERDADSVSCANQESYPDIWQEERKLLEQYGNETATPSVSPRFDFLVWYSTHYNYFYPQSDEVFRPTLPLGFEIAPGYFRHMEGHAKELKNRYKNAVHYFDKQVGALLARLRETGRLDDTIVIITGDHGEEFWERGRFGHSYGFGNEQTQVTLFAHFPEKVRSDYAVSSHADLFPTIFDYMNVELPSRPFMTGKSLLDYDPAREWALVSKGVVMFQVELEHMIVSPELKVRFMNEGIPQATKLTDLRDNTVKASPQSVQELLTNAVRAKSLGADFR